MSLDGLGLIFSANPTLPSGLDVVLNRQTTHILRTWQGRDTQKQSSSSIILSEKNVKKISFIFSNHVNSVLYAAVNCLLYTAVLFLNNLGVGSTNIFSALGI